MIDFLVGILPDLVKLAEGLFEAFDGDQAKARENIQDRTKQIKENRARRDKQLAEKHGS